MTTNLQREKTVWRCYWQTIKEWKTFFSVLFDMGAIYIAHEYVEQKPYTKGNKVYYPMKCKVCGKVSKAWRQL